MSEQPTASVKETLSALRQQFVKAIDAPFAKYALLTKSRQIEVLHYTLALGGGLLLSTAPIALSVNDAVLPAVESFKELWELKNHSSLKAVWGTAASGGLVLGLNVIFGRIFSEIARKEEHATEEEKKKIRQDKRGIEAVSDFSGAARWVPQFVQGVKEGNVETAVAAGLGGGSYALAMARKTWEFCGRVRNPEFNLKKSFPRIDKTLRALPGWMQTVRGPSQFIPAMTVGWAVHPSVGLVWGAASVVQTVGGRMTVIKDRDYSERNVVPKPPEA